MCNPESDCTCLGPVADGCSLNLFFCRFGFSSAAIMQFSAVLPRCECCPAGCWLVLACRPLRRRAWWPQSLVRFLLGGSAVLMLHSPLPVAPPFSAWSLPVEEGSLLRACRHLPMS